MNISNLEQELEILREELCQVRDLTKLNVTTFPHSLRFPSSETFLQNTFPNLHIHPRTVPNLSLPTQAGTIPSYPVMQHICGAYVATSYEPDVPPVYAVKAPAFTAPVAVRVPYEVDHIFGRTFHHDSTEGTSNYLDISAQIHSDLIYKKLDYNSKEVPWDYQAEEKTKMINTATTHGMTRTRRCYIPDNLNKPAPGREQNHKRNVTNAEIAEYWKKM
ncbi:hypothetical protein HAX54_017471 [Datura stramonium]|uniref:Uncharacterized protein n=1 Tax=Datura stramonium TaxID=4076 RepID=A0ABS8Y4F6_DATST|nr:hypothetical protein [Datura stramonium]